MKTCKVVILSFHTRVVEDLNTHFDQGHKKEVPRLAQKTISKS